MITFNGHKSAISALDFDQDGVRLTSGSTDTDIIVWDLVSEVGLFKLRGHKDRITGLRFLEVANNEIPRTAVGSSGDAPMDQSDENVSHITHSYLISTSKDSLLKLWDLTGQNCIETHVAQSNGQCWSMALSPDNSGLITAGNEGELRVWGTDLPGLSRLGSKASNTSQNHYLREKGTLYRRAKDRTTGVSFHPLGMMIAAYGAERSVEIWRIRSEDEVRKKLARKRKRKAEKLKGMNGTVNDDTTKTNQEDITSAGVDDLLASHVDIRVGGKVRSVDWAKPGSHKHLHVVSSQSNNQVELFRAPLKSKSRQADTVDIEAERIAAIEMPGHRTDIRSLAISSDDRMLASASQGCLKIWNLRTSSCIRTLDCGYALCVAFVPGDKIVIVGNRQGELEIFDIASSTLIDTVKAHDDKVWSLHVHPDGTSIATASEDKSAKFFRFEVVQQITPGTESTSPRFKLTHTRTLKVNDSILSIRHSPDGRLVALALLDNTVKVFFTDSLKLFLNLYGHKLPVLSLDISYDSKLIVTCSADKNVRIWGLDFGDCHKALFAHQDTITQVAFIPKNQDGNGHHFFSASKDRAVKYWDGDKFEQIQKFEGHHSEIWAMALSATGEFLVTAGHDKSIRVWEQTDELVFLEEEREKELEELYDSTLAASLDRKDPDDGEQSEAVEAGKQTMETLMAGEKIAEALAIGLEDLRLMQGYENSKMNSADAAPPSRNPVYLANKNISAEAHLLKTVQKIHAAALQDALLVLTFDQACSFFLFLRIWAERKWNMPLTCRILFFLLKTHHKQIVASKQTRVLLDGIRSGLRQSLEQQKDEIGFNLAALQFLGRRMAELGTSDFIDEAAYEEDATRDRKKRGFVDVA